MSVPVEVYLQVSIVLCCQHVLTKNKQKKRYFSSNTSKVLVGMDPRIQG